MITIMNNTDHPGSQLDVKVIGEYIENGIHDSVSVIGQGVNRGKMRANRWYHIWLCKGSKGNAFIRIQRKNPKVMLKRLIGAVRTNSKADFLLFRQVDNLVRYNGGWTLASDAVTGKNIWRKLDVKHLVPHKVARGVFLRADCGRLDSAGPGLAQITFSMRNAGDNADKNQNQRFLTTVRGYSRDNDERDANRDEILCFISEDEGGSIYFSTADGSKCAIILTGFML